MSDGRVDHVKNCVISTGVMSDHIRHQAAWEDGLLLCFFINLLI